MAHKEPIHDDKAMNTKISGTSGRIKEMLVKRRKAKKMTGKGGMKKY